jgi:hypothetical protein
VEHNQIVKVLQNVLIVMLVNMQQVKVIHIVQRPMWDIMLTTLVVVIKNVARNICLQIKQDQQAVNVTELDRELKELAVLVRLCVIQENFQKNVQIVKNVLLVDMEYLLKVFHAHVVNLDQLVVQVLQNVYVALKTLLLIINHVQQNANRVMMVKQLKEKYVKQNVLNVKNVQKQSHV